MFTNPKPRSDWRKGDRTVFDKRRGSRSVSERKIDYRSNTSQQSHLANCDKNNNNYICYTEKDNSGNNYNNDDNTHVDCNRVSYSDMHINNMNIQNIPNKLNHERIYSESCQNSRHKRKDSIVSRSQNFEGN